MGMMKEFKEFAVKGNVMDMAVGIVIGAAFGTIVKSFVADVIMPPIGLLLGNVEAQARTVFGQEWGRSFVEAMVCERTAAHVHVSP